MKEENTVAIAKGVIGQSEHLLALSVFTAYILGSFLFEPDFGSWVRHEAATFPVLHMIACSPVMYSGFRLVRRV